MKKLLSLCLAVVMMVCLLAGVSVNAATNKYYTLRKENFGIPIAGVWDKRPVASAMLNAGCPPLNMYNGDPWNGCVVQSKAANAEATAEIYVDTAGTYTAFMLVAQNEKPITLSIAGQATTTGFGARLVTPPAGTTTLSYMYGWEIADRTWSLSAGWNTVKVTAPAAYAEFGVIVITNNTSLTPANIEYVMSGLTPTAGKTNISVYEDCTAPTINSFVGIADENAANEHRTSATLTWAATDASGIAKYEVHNGTEWVDVTGETSYTVNDLWSASTYTFKLKVTDYFGYTTETTASVTTNGPEDTEGPEWPADAELEVENKAFSATISWPEATDSRGIAGYEIREGSEVGTLLETITEGRTYTVSLEPGDEKDIYVIAKDLSGFTSDAIYTTVESLAGTKNFTLREGNFELGTAWGLLNIGSAEQGKGGTPLNHSSETSPGTAGQALQAKTAGGVTTTDIYVDEPGEYVLFAQLHSGYKIKASIGGGAYSGYLASTPVFNASNERTYVWAKADTVWNLEAGWNTVKLAADDTGCGVVAVYITNGVNVEADELTYIAGSTTLVSEGKLNIARYEDTEAPTFDGDIDVDYDTATNVATITWPAATDEDYVRTSYTMPATELKAYKIYVNDKAIGEVAHNAERTFTIDEASLGRALVPGEILNIKVDAIDRLGNAAEKTLPYEVSKFAISRFAITSSTTAELVIKNVSEAPADVRLSIAIYDATGDLVAGNYTVYTVAADGVDYTVPVTITTGAPADMTEYTVKAHLWNPGDLTPVSANWPTIVQ